MGRYVISQFAIVLPTFASYFILAGLMNFSTPQVGVDVTILGILCLGMTCVLLRPAVPRLRVSATTALYLLTGSTLALIPIAIYGLVTTGGQIQALVDERFKVPGYGAVFALMAASMLVGPAVFLSARGAWLKALYIILAVLCGVIFGGKGFVLPVAMGLALGYQLGAFEFKLWKGIVIALLAAAGAIAAQAAQVGSLTSALALVGVRVALQADAVRWLSMMSAADIHAFPIEWPTFLIDLVGRLVGERINALSVGAEMAYLVNGDASGGGPNPLLPVLAYVLTRGSLIEASMFVVVAVLTLWLLIRLLVNLLPKEGIAAVIMSAIIFNIPIAVIDFVGLLQSVTCLCIVGGLSWLATLPIRHQAIAHPSAT
jgi:hypothetical protein